MMDGMKYFVNAWMVNKMAIAIKIKNLNVDLGLIEIGFVGLLRSAEKIVRSFVKKPFKKELSIEIFESKKFYDYFKLPEMVLKGDGNYGKVEGLYCIVDKNTRGVAIVFNDNWKKILIHELTHAVDFDKFSNIRYKIFSKIMKRFRKFRKYDRYEKRAWKNEKEWKLK